MAVAITPARIELPQALFASMWAADSKANKLPRKTLPSENNVLKADAANRPNGKPPK